MPPRSKTNTAASKDDKSAATALIRAPDAPPHLSPGAREEWLVLAPVATELGTLRPADLRAFELLCDMLATATEAAEAMRNEGMTVLNSGGGKRAHPAAGIMRESRAQAARLLEQFGLTPKSRAFVKAPPPPAAENPFAKFIGQKRGA